MLFFFSWIVPYFIFQYHIHCVHKIVINKIIKKPYHICINSLYFLFLNHIYIYTVEQKTLKLSRHCWTWPISRSTPILHKKREPRMFARTDQIAASKYCVLGFLVIFIPNGGLKKEFCCSDISQSSNKCCVIICFSLKVFGMVWG